MNELVACFVDGDDARKELLDANAVVFNFAPLPSSNAVFGGTHYKLKKASEKVINLLAAASFSFLPGKSSWLLHKAK